MTCEACRGVGDRGTFSLGGFSFTPATSAFRPSPSCRESFGVAGLFPVPRGSSLSLSGPPAPAQIRHISNSPPGRVCTVYTVLCFVIRRPSDPSMAPPYDLHSRSWCHCCRLRHTCLRLFLACSSSLGEGCGEEERSWVFLQVSVLSSCRRQILLAPALSNRFSIPH